MAKQPPKTREDRLKDALKANMGRRKAQSRARADDGSEATEEAGQEEQDG